MRKYGVLILLCVYGALSAQSFEEQFRAFQQQANQSYSDFRQEANKRYADFLRAAWEYYQQAPSIPQPKEEPVPPVVYDDQQQQQEEETPIVVVPTPEPEPTPQPIAPIEENTTPSTMVQIVYQGTSFSFRCPKDKIQLKGISGDELAANWEVLSTTDYDNLLYDIMKAKKDYRLCDWAYIELTGELSKHIYTQSNEAKLFHAYVLAQSGYAVRLGKNSQGKLYVLLGSQYQIYDYGYFTIDDMYFYPLEKPNGGLSICSGAYEKEQPFSLCINPEQRFALNKKESPIRKSSQGITAACTINQNTIGFYNTYPTGQIGNDCGTRWATYANAPMEECVRNTLYPTLMQAIRGVPEAQAVGKLLNWVQTAFEYEYDDKVWGQDRAFFPSETLHYPYADCEDRAILFSRIVRDLMKLDVVLIYYPGHLAAAVAFHQDVKGDYVLYNSTKYIVCDPTYIGAPIGSTMPDMDNHTAKLIPLQR